MQRKVDFDLHLDAPLAASDIKVGQEVVLQEHSGAWTCSWGSHKLGPVPDAVLAQLHSFADCKATLRSLKRSTENSELVSSLQIRVSLQSAGGQPCCSSSNGG